MNQRLKSIGMLVFGLIHAGVWCDQSTVPEKKIVQQVPKQEQDLATSDRKEKQKERQEKRNVQYEAVRTVLDVDEALSSIEPNEMVSEAPLKGSRFATPEKFKINLEKKRQQAIDLINKVVGFIEQPGNSLASIGYALTHTKDYKHGELYSFLYDADGVCLAHGQESNLLWRDMSDYTDDKGINIVQEFFKVADDGGGWVKYQWRYATKESYVRYVSNNGKKYLVGAGYYPHSMKYDAISMVQNAVSYFNKAVTDGLQIKDALSYLSYPGGDFVQGNLYIFGLDKKGITTVQGDLPGLVGIDEWKWSSSDGMLVHQAIIKGINTQDTGVWVDYTFRSGFKSSYAQMVQDEKGGEHYFGVGYYPFDTHSAARALIQRAFTSMKSRGKSASFEDFSLKKATQKSAYHFGSIYLEVYDMNGVCVAHGDKPLNVGQNFYDVKDQHGNYYVRNIIEQAKSGGGWVDVKLKNDYQSISTLFIDIGVDQFAIAAGVFPINKYESMVLLQKDAMGRMRRQSDQKALSAIARTGESGTFIRGDLDVFVFDEKGTCYVNGDNFDSIWRNLSGIKDDDGVEIVQLFIKEALKKGASRTIGYKVNGAQKYAYVKLVEKGSRKYIIGSSMYV